MINLIYFYLKGGGCKIQRLFFGSNNYMYRDVFSVKQYLTIDSYHVDRRKFKDCSCLYTTWVCARCEYRYTSGWILFHTTHGILIIRNTCAIYVILRCFLVFFIHWYAQMFIMVSAYVSFSDFPSELLKNFGWLRFTQFFRILRTLYAKHTQMFVVRHAYANISAFIKNTTKIPVCKWNVN